MRRSFIAVLAVLALAVGAITAPAAWAGSPHFVFVNISTLGNTVTVAGKEAGLGNEDQVHIEVTATAECINGGSNKPKAANKETFSAEGDFPVQNGKADFALTLTASFQPSCNPPMSVVFSNISVTDTTNGISYP